MGEVIVPKTISTHVFHMRLSKLSNLLMVLVGLVSSSCFASEAGEDSSSARSKSEPPVDFVSSGFYHAVFCNQEYCELPSTTSNFTYSSKNNCSIAMSSYISTPPLDGAKGFCCRGPWEEVEQQILAQMKVAPAGAFPIEILQNTAFSGDPEGDCVIPSS